jgi:hypothetical protein
VRRETLGRRSATVTAPAPGLYTVAETGPGIAHRAAVAVNAAAAAPERSAIDLRTARLRAPHASRSSLARWLIVAALAVLALEWGYWSATRRTVAV